MWTPEPWFSHLFYPNAGFECVCRMSTLKFASHCFCCRTVFGSIYSVLLEVWADLTPSVVTVEVQLNITENIQRITAQQQYRCRTFLGSCGWKPRGPPWPCFRSPPPTLFFTYSCCFVCQQTAPSSSERYKTRPPGVRSRLQVDLLPFPLTLRLPP